MSDPAPRVSVLMPVFNGLPHLWAAATSILEQTFTDFEFLIVDDGSTDGSGEACDAIALRDGRVRVIRHEGRANRGIVESLNLGLSSARGELIARMDADDRAYPERIESQVAYLDAYPDVALVGSAVHVQGPEGELVTRTPPSSPALIRWSLHFGISFTHPTVTMRRSAAAAVGGYTADYPHNEDHDLWLRMARRYRLANLERPLLYFDTQGTANISSLHADRQRETTLDLVQRAMSDLVPGVDRDVAADLHDAGYGRPLADRPGAETGKRVRDAIKLLSTLTRAASQRWPADAAVIGEDAARRMDALAWRLRGEVGWGRARALRSCARWAPRLFARSAARRVANRLTPDQPEPTL